MNILFSTAAFCIIVMLMRPTLGAATVIDCFGMKCPTGSVSCVYSEKSVASNSLLAGEALCLNRRKRILLKSSSEWSNAKGDNVYNQYQFFGPGVYNKERVNYAKKKFTVSRPVATNLWAHDLSDVRKRLNEDFGRQIKEETVSRW